jgi:hypothetical protein
MSQGYRVGVPTRATQVTAGTDNDLTAPRVVQFSNYGRPVIVANQTGNGNAIRVKINATDTNFSTDLGHFSINDGFAVDVSLGGLVNVVTVSFVTLAGGDSLDNVGVVGWTV